MEAYQLLEKEWAEWNGLDPAGMVVCSSGTAALHLALESLRLPPDAKVITSDYNMVAVPRAIVLAGLKPVFVDCDGRLLIDPQAIRAERYHDRFNAIEAIVATHIYGRRCDMGDLDSLAAFHNWSVIEDLAEAHGIRPHPSTAAACWSFYRNKIVGGEEGGAVWFRNPEHAGHARQLRTLGFTPAHDYHHLPRGHNYRLANCLAAQVRGSLDSADGNIAARHQIEVWYDHACPDAWRMPRRDAVWVYDLRVRGMDTATQTRAVHALQDRGIAARHGFQPMSAQEEFGGRACHPTAARLASEIIYLPVQPGLTSRTSVATAFEIMTRILG